MLAARACVLIHGAHLAAESLGGRCDRDREVEQGVFTGCTNRFSLLAASS